jgi:hypothetical protein
MQRFRRAVAIRHDRAVKAGGQRERGRGHDEPAPIDERPSRTGAERLADQRRERIAIVKAQVDRIGKTILPGVERADARDPQRREADIEFHPQRAAKPLVANQRRRRIERNRRRAGERSGEKGGQRKDGHTAKRKEEHIPGRVMEDAELLRQGRGEVKPAAPPEGLRSAALGASMSTSVFQKAKPRSGNSARSAPALGSIL